MKKILLSIFTLAVVGITAKVDAQYPCNGGPNNCAIAVSNTVVTVTNKIINPNNSSQIIVTFDVSFDLSYNNGNTHFYINSFLAQDYPNYWPCGNGNHPAPTATQLGTNRDQLNKSFLDIELQNPARGAVGVPVSMTISTVYQYDATVELTSPANSPGMTASKTFLSGSTDRVTIRDAVVIVNAGLNDPILVKSDVWAENGNAHCYQAGITQAFNDPSISGLIPCSSPRKINFGITTVNPVLTTFSYKFYKDDGDGIIEIGTDDIDVTPAPTPANNNNTLQASAGTGQVGGSFDYVGNNVLGSTLGSFWVVVTPVGSTSSVSKLITPVPGVECAPLPVDFKSFTATRNRSSVLLRWETSTEVNNSGFAVERNLNGTWEQIAFVNSQAANGNSDALLTYTYSDMNNAKGITQYRIKQVDFDNKSKYTEIRSVRGLDQIGKVTVYPNPTSNGTVNVVFDDASVIRTISVMDMSGRTLKQINNVSNNNITIDNLQPGMYTLRILVPETGEQTVQKIVVNKR